MRSLALEQLEHRRVLATTVDTPLDVIDSTDGLTTLREAIAEANANPGSTISFDNTVFNGELVDVIRLGSQLPSITADVTIDATGTTEVVISGDVNGDDTPVAGTKVTDLSATATTELDDNVRLLEVSAGSTTLIGLTLTGGRTTGAVEPGGAVLFNSNGSLMVGSSLISGNSTEGFVSYGGAIHAVGAVTLTDSEVRGNRTNGPYAEGGGISSIGGVTLTGSRVQGNSTASGGSRGGGISSAADVSLMNSTVSGNFTAGVSSKGGGISTVGSVTLMASTVSDNRTEDAASDGGGIYSLGNVALYESAVSGNSTQGDQSRGGGIFSGADLIVFASSISNNSTAEEDAGGGGIASLGSTELTNSTVSGNATLGFGSKGGGIFAGDAVTLNNSTVTSNSTAMGLSEGGGVYSSVGMIGLTNSILAGNSSSSFGPDLFSFTPNLTASYSLIGNNEGSGVAESQVPDASGNLIGGSIGGFIDPQLGPLADNGGATLTHTPLLSSPALNGGDPSFDPNTFFPPLINDQRGDGFPRVIGGRVDMGSHERGRLVVDLADDENDGDLSPGDLSLREAIQEASTTGFSLIQFDPAVFNGEASDVIRLQLGQLVISAAVHIDGGTLDVVITGDADGNDELVSGTFVTNISASTAQNKLDDNSARIFDVTAPSGNEVKFTGLTVTGANLGENGAGIQANVASLVIEYSSVSGNRVSGKGGGIYTYTGSVSISNSTISGNSSGLSGGGIYTESGIVNLTGSTVVGNETGYRGQGGGIFNLFGPVSVASSTIRDNTSGDSGGGISAGFDALTVTSSTVTGNSSGDDGGGIYASIDGLTVTDSTVSGNTSRAKGGGIWSCGMMTLTNSTVTGNRSGAVGGSGADGGGIFANADVTVVDSTVSSNSSSGDGGGIYTYDGALAVVNSTVSGNTSSFGGAGVFTDYGSLAVVNSTISGNSSGLRGGGVWASDAIALIENSTITANMTAASGGGLVLVDINDSDPQRLTIRNSIVAGNTDAGMAPDVKAPDDPANELVVEFSLIGNDTGAGLNLGTSNSNLVNVDPLLGPLADNGGPTQTHALLLGSPAMNVGEPSFNPNAFTPPLVNDQRGPGFARVADSRIDIGAFETQAWVVDLADDENDGDFSSGDLSLREAIQLANTVKGADVIRFDATVFNGEANDVIRLQLGQLDITESVEIDGGTLDVVISGDVVGNDELVSGTFVTDISASSAQNKLGDNSARIFDVTAPAGDEVRFTGLTITGASLVIRGAGIRGFESDLVIEQSTVAGNRGGGVITTSGDVTVTASTISGNIAEDDGGGIFASSGAVIVTNSNISGNSTYDRGGGIANFYGSVMVTDSVISGNRGGDGGGIGTYNAPVTVTNSTVTGNSSGIYGGGIYTFGGALTIAFSTVSDNRSDFWIGGGIAAAFVNVISSSVSGNTSGSHGGGIVAFSDLSVTNSTVSGNSSSRDGGGIYTFGSNVLIENSTVTGNQASAVGGGVGHSAYSSYERLTIRNSIVAGNTDNGTAPDVQSPEDPVNDLLVEFSLIGDDTGAGLDQGASNNNLVNLDPMLGPLADNGGPTRTHALLAVSSAINAGDPSFDPNAFTPPLVEDQRGTGFDRVSGSRIDIGAFERQIFVVDLATDENDGDFSAGDLSLREAIQQANLSGLSTIRFDPTVFDGEAVDVIRLQFGPLVITESLHVDAGAVDVVVSGDANGNDVLVSGSFVTDTFASGAQNRLADNSPRIFDVTASGGHQVTFTGLTITGGNLGDDGAGIRATNANLVLERSSVSGNRATNRGGGAYLRDGALTATNSTISGNSSYSVGGGVYTRFGAVDLIASDVSLNQSNSQGGGIRTYLGLVTVTHSMVTGNSSNQAGGGIYSAAGHVTVTRSVIIGNTSGFTGGGIDTLTAGVTVTESTLRGNSSTDLGGGLSSYSGALNVTDSTLSGNSSRYGGGLATNSGSVTLTNSTVSGNSSSQIGGGLWTDDSSVLVQHSTITGNSAGDIGGGIALYADNYTDDERLTLRNSIVAGNVDNGTAPDVQAPGDPTNDLVVEFSLIGDETGSGLNLGTSFSNLVNVDPHLGPLADNGGPTQTHALLPGSPAINAGDPSFDPSSFTPPLVNDQRAAGFVRVSDARIDIGAFERQVLIVDLAVDENDGDFSQGDLSLREAILLANAAIGPDQINFDASVFNGEANDVIRLQLGQLVISEAVHIDGKMLDVVISGDVNGDDVHVSGTFVTDIAGSEAQNRLGDNSQRIFEVTAPSGDEVKLTGLTVTGGNLGGSGAAISGQHANLVIERSLISGNRTAFSGGGIYTRFGAVTVTHSTVSGNNGQKGVGIYSYTGSVTITNSTVSGNNGRIGVGIYSYTGPVTITNGTVSGNSSSLKGGGIYSIAGPVTITNSTVSGNSSSLDGGGIFTSFGSVEVTNSTVSGNSSGRDGAGIWTDDVTVLIANSTITDNTAVGKGGGIGLYADNVNDYERLSVRNSIVAGNVDNGTAPDIQAPGDPINDLVVEFSLIGNDTGSGLVLGTSNNNLLNIGPLLGPLADNGGPTQTHLPLAGSPVINRGDSSFDPNALTPPLVNDQRGTGFARVTDRRIDIGAVERQRLVVDLALDENDGDVSQGDLSLREAIQLASNGRIDDIAFDPVVFNGEAIDVIRLQLGPLIINDPIQIDGGRLDVVISGDANGDDIPLLGTFVTDIAASDAQNRLSDNSARIFDVTVSAGEEVRLSGLTVTGGNLADVGAGIKVDDAQLFIEQSSVTGNRATNSGGGIYSRVGNVTVTDGTISGNTVSDKGGGIFTQYGAIMVMTSTVSGNSSGGVGGGIYSYGGPVTLSDSLVSGNSAIAGAGGIGTNVGAVTATKSTISGNLVTVGEGAGICTVDGAIDLVDSTVSGNLASVAAGINAYNSSVTLTNSTVNGNTSTGVGGGALVFMGSLNVVNSTFSGNRGGGIWAGYVTVLIENSTITANTAGVGGGIALYTPNNTESLTIRNSIVAGNTDNGTAPDVQSPGDPANNLVVEFSLIGNDTGSGLSQGTSNNNVVNVDAQLGPLADNGGPTQTHALLAGSPAINMGDPSFDPNTFTPPLVNDQRGAGFPRVTNGRIDMGAYELQSSGCDLDGDSDCDIDDIDAVIMAIAAGMNNPLFDLNVDGFVDLADRDRWLADAGALNLPSGNAYLLGDSNLDGNVDGVDFIIWNNNKFEASGRWSQGDWNADGTTDGLDFIIWNNHKFQTADDGAPLVDRVFANLFTEDEEERWR